MSPPTRRRRARWEQVTVGHGPAAWALRVRVDRLARTLSPDVVERIALECGMTVFPLPDRQEQRA